MRNVVILGAAGRDFHNFNVWLRDDPARRVVAFTAAQIPGIDRRTYPAMRCGPRYPDGIPIVPESALEETMRAHDVHEVVFSYSDVTHAQVMHLASRALACGATFVLPGAVDTALAARVPVVSVLAARTGAGKSTIARRVMRMLRESGRSPVAVRHPMPYGPLDGPVERYATSADVLASGLTVEAMEEYQQHVDEGSVVLAGVDYADVLARAQAEGDAIVWDGGNNDLGFLRADLTLAVLDATRPGEEDAYHPGEAVVRSADLIVINKINVATADGIARARSVARALNPLAPILHARSLATIDHPRRVAGRRVLVIEDGPSLTHGGMAEAVGAQAARALGATLVDPRPHAVGSIADAYRRYPHIGPVLPALGYDAQQWRDLEATIAAVPCDCVVMGTPARLEAAAAILQPVARVRFEAELDQADVLLAMLRSRLRDPSV